MDYHERENENYRKRMELIERQKRLYEHDCVGDADNCNEVHSGVAKISILSTKHMRSQQLYPSKWRNWIGEPKVCIYYMNQHTLTMETFNLTEAFKQMNTNGKLNLTNSIIEHLLDDDERSLLFADLQES